MFTFLPIFCLFIVVIHCQAPMIDYQECGLMPAADSNAGQSTSHSLVTFISGGDPANPNANQFPWMAAIRKLQFRPEPNIGRRCGGSIVGNRWILTAGHCVDKWSEEEATILEVGVGSPNKDQMIWKIVKKGHLYPIWKNWDFPNRDFDIALLELAEGNHLQMGPSVRKICLPLCYPIVDGNKALVMGWGQQHWNAQGNRRPNPASTNHLQYGPIELRRWGTGACDDFRMNPWYFCGIGKSETLKWTMIAPGDSGGPVTVKTEKPGDANSVIYYQIGIITGSILPEKLKNLNPKEIDYFMNTFLAVDHFCEWIRITTNDEVHCQKIKGAKVEDV